MKLIKIFESMIGDAAEVVTEAKAFHFEAEQKALFAKMDAANSRKNPGPKLTADEISRLDKLTAVIKSMTSKSTNPRYGSSLNYDLGRGQGIALGKRDKELYVQKQSDYANKTDAKFDKFFPDTKAGWVEAAEYFMTLLPKNP